MQPPTLARRFPGLEGIRFDSTDSVVAQSRRLAGAVRPLTTVTGATATGVPTPPPGRSVQLAVTLKSLSCVRETSKFFPEVDPDSIDVGSTVFDTARPVGTTALFNAGRDYRSGTARSFAPAVLLGTADIALEGSWPRTFAAPVLMLERDDGGATNADVKTVFERARDQVAQWVAEGAGDLLAAFVGADLGRVLGQFIGECIKRLADAVFNAFGNDDFPVQTLLLTVPDAASLTSRERVAQTIRLEGAGGLYLMGVEVDWRRTDKPVGERLVDSIEVTVGTGGDDLRNNSVAWASVTFRNGSEARVSLNNGDGLSNNTVRTFTIPVVPQRKVSDLAKLTIHHESRNGFLQHDDNWDLDLVRLRTNGPDPVTEVLSAGGSGLLKRFTGQDHDWTMLIRV